MVLDGACLVVSGVCYSVCGALWQALFELIDNAIEATQYAAAHGGHRRMTDNTVRWQLSVG